MVKVIPRIETKHLIERCMEEIASNPQYGIPWIILDRDEVLDFDEIIDSAKRNQISVGWSNPCFEIWLYGYFSYPPSIHDSISCCTAFSRKFKEITGQEYEKSDTGLYRKLVRFGDEECAINHAQTLYKNNSKRENKKPSDSSPATTVHKLIGEIRQKCRDAAGESKKR
jgi:hypothetical protein